MKVTLTRRFLAHAAVLVFLPALVTSVTPDPAANLAACKLGSTSCDRRRLSLSEMTEVAEASHARNVASCQTGLGSCDRSRLTVAEAEVSAPVPKPRRR